jgi:hypothetical protein
MARLRPIFLLLALAGAVIPMRHFLAWFAENGVDFGLLVEAWTVNRAAEGMLYDLTISAIALTVAVIAHALERRDWVSLLCVPATYFIGVSCALPLFFWFRARPA